MQPSLVFLNVGTPYYTTLTPIIICRFILNLRYTKPSGSSYPSNSNSASYRFTGNMGESLSIVGDEEDGDDYGGGFNYSNDSDNSDAVEMSVIERGLGDGVDAAPGENSDPHRV
ncbi:hypothetical protein BDY19DRAFT_995862 [Irpex rosettiformis]|uniref:Uncharacterized protein n=1 Tax=Irpex rosettiformis TaxID=378272 RepID=A0ACB8TXA3_9APHY|nr:hypothetical protein BDY19DRAFT_995862 [Irpex rosettiformis]